MGWYFRHLVDTENIERRYSDIEIMKRLLHYVKRYKWQLFLIVLSIVISSLASLAGPYLIMIAIDDYITKANYQGLLYVSLLYLGVYIIFYFTNYASTYYINYVGQKVIFDLRQDTFKKVQNLSMDYFSKLSAGDIISRLTNDINTLNQVLISGLASTIADSLTLIAIVIIMLSINVELSLVSFTVIPLLVLSTIIFSKLMRSAYRETRRAISKLTSKVEQTISGVQAVKMFSREQSTIKSFSRINLENYQANIRASKILAAFYPVVDFINALGVSLVLWYGGLQIIHSSLSVGVLVAFLSYLSRFFQPIANISLFYNNIQSAFAASERVFDLMDAEPSVKEKENAIDLPPFSHEIKFENVYFEYEPGLPVIQNFNLKIQKGEKIALIGHTGAGKTTIVKLLLRFYDVTKGRILIDGYDIRDITLKSLRNQIAIVLQEPFLFNTTIKENIRYGNPAASDEEIIRVAKELKIHDLIMKKPNGYDTVVGEGGKLLSTGERQLISFARALLANPNILILDEATASVDSYTEQLIQEGIKKLMEGRTAIIIAHRLSTIRNVDKIVLMDKGRILDIGTHEEMLRRNPLYKELYEMQFLFATKV
ncbi:MAG: ABC transporter ATP-binding protein [Candidatus Asgardarchaeia archaeon]